MLALSQLSDIHVNDHISLSKWAKGATLYTEQDLISLCEEFRAQDYAHLADDYFSGLHSLQC